MPLDPPKKPLDPPKKPLDLPTHPPLAIVTSNQNNNYIAQCASYEKRESENASHSSKYVTALTPAAIGTVSTQPIAVVPTVFQRTAPAPSARPTPMIDPTCDIPTTPFDEARLEQQ